MAKEKPAETTALVKYEPKLPMRPTEIEDDVDISPEDLVLPRLQLLQDMSAEVQEGEGKAGQFQHTITGEIFDDLHLIIWGHFKSRVCFGDELGTVDCMSRDGITSSFGEHAGNSCLSCPKSKFVDVNGNQKEKGPECNLVYNFACSILNWTGGENPGLTVLPFRSTALKVGRKMVQQKLNRFAWWERIWHITSEFVKSAKGNYYIPNAAIERESTDEEKEIGKELYQQFFKPLRSKIVVDYEEKTPGSFEPTVADGGDEVPF